MSKKIEITVNIADYVPRDLYERLEITNRHLRKELSKNERMLNHIPATQLLTIIQAIKDEDEKDQNLANVFGS